LPRDGPEAPEDLAELLRLGGGRRADDLAVLEEERARRLLVQDEELPAPAGLRDEGRHVAQPSRRPDLARQPEGPPRLPGAQREHALRRAAEQRPLADPRPERLARVLPQRVDGAGTVDAEIARPIAVGIAGHPDKDTHFWRGADGEARNAFVPSHARM